jgi:glycerol-3-phosphate acyltransferase PlsY
LITLAVTTVLLCLLAYVLGSLPFGLWVVKLLKGIDVREVGSGNIGTTNVYRAAGKGAAIGVFLLDVAKGALPVALAMALHLPDWVPPVVGAAAIIGHSKSIFLGFTGGKSVATGIGTILALSPLSAVIALALWGVVFAASRMVSLGSILAAVSLPVVLWALHAPLATIVYAVIAAVYVVVRHRANIQRILAGEENRL